MPLDLGTLEFVDTLRRARSSAADWKTAFDALLVAVREEFVYDHVALYMLDATGQSLDVSRARAVGRGKTAEADASWGEILAGRVVAGQETIILEPDLGAQGDRLDAPYRIGLPIFVASRLGGVLVFVRFGGPAYSHSDRLLADAIAGTVSSLLASRSLQEARGELESVQRRMQLQDDFLSTISHELRTPLGFIKGYATSLLRQDTKWDEKTRREFLSVIVEETDRVTRLIENMLETARLHSNTLTYDLRPLRLDALVRQVTSRTRAHLPGLEVDLVFDSVPAIRGDREQLSQVLENLFSNAVKYAPGSPLTIRIRRRPRSLRLSFEDRGPGIPEEFLPFIFERFYRVPSQAGSTGTGLGLYICQQIVLAHHGKVWAESAPGEGTTFFIELPIKSAS